MAYKKEGRGGVVYCAIDVQSYCNSAGNAGGRGNTNKDDCFMHKSLKTISCTGQTSMEVRAGGNRRIQNRTNGWVRMNLHEQSEFTHSGSLVAAGHL